MTKDVLITVSGVQYETDGGKDPIVIMVPGTYHFRNNKHYLIYDEYDEDGEVTKNTVKIAGDQVDVIRKGLGSSHMVFEKHKENLSYYNTPFGSMLMGVTTTKIDFTETIDKMDLAIDYSLAVDGRFVSDCTIKVEVKAKQ